MSFVFRPPPPRQQSRSIAPLSGVTSIAFQLSVIGAAAVSDTLSVARALLDAIVGAATVADTLSVARALQLAAAPKATVTDAIVVTRPLLLTATPKATVADALSVTRPLAWAPHGVVAAAIDLSIQGQVAFLLSVSAHAAVADLLSAARPVAVSSTGHAAATLTAGIARGLLTSITGASSTAVHSPAVARGMAALLAPRAAVAGQFNATRPLAVSVSASALVADALLVLSRNQIFPLSTTAQRVSFESAPPVRYGAVTIEIQRIKE